MRRQRRAFQRANRAVNVNGVIGNDAHEEQAKYRGEAGPPRLAARHQRRRTLCDAHWQYCKPRVRKKFRAARLLIKMREGGRKLHSQGPIVVGRPNAYAPGHGAVVQKRLISAKAEQWRKFRSCLERCARLVRYHVFDVREQGKLRGWSDGVVGLLLFLATAMVVVWQNSRLGVLWDLSYILENAYRISLGQVPYRDFPLPYPPLTFVTQAALIKFAGRAFWHHVLYCAVVSGVATVLSWRILLRLLRGAVERPRFVASVLSAPLTVLGIYCIFPHPFYDCDCTFAILLCLLLLLHVEERGFPSTLSFFSGLALVVPPLVKQNTGLAFLGSAVLAILALLIFDRRREQAVRGYGLMLGGITAGLALAAMVIHFTAGLQNYQHWTIQYAAARRMPSLSNMLSVYDNRLLLWWLPAFVAGALLLSLRRASSGLVIFAAVLLSVPFLGTSACLLGGNDSSDKAECLLSLWPFLLIVSFLASVWTARQRKGMTLMAPFIVIATVHGAFLSQQVWGSTYALWPLAMILIASTLTGLAAGSKERPAIEVVVALLIAAPLCISGAHYVWNHERLDYANVSDGQPQHSTLPALRGLTARGAWLPQFDELVAYAKAEIPAEDGLLMIPGEDLFSYATGREPRFPVLMFDHTVNPYSPEEIAQMARAHNIRWLVVKRELQLEADPVEDRNRLLDLLRKEFAKVEELDNYDVYRRVAALQ